MIARSRRVTRVFSQRDRAQFRAAIRYTQRETFCRQILQRISYSYCPRPRYVAASNFA